MTGLGTLSTTLSATWSTETIGPQPLAAASMTALYGLVWRAARKRFMNLPVSMRSGQARKHSESAAHVSTAS